ncbi:MAG: histidinol-phosphatase [Tenericutes bacterium]|nr:histidinol-phosphatase [Mycoplasmatota bacterium]
MSSENKLVNTNYHTHMYLCRHAKGTTEDYVLQAINYGFKQIGMSDHAPWKELALRSERMYLKDYQKYLQGLAEVKKKYSDQIKIDTGLEIEYFKFKDKYYQDFLKDVDYLVLGQHYIEMNGKLRSIYKIKTLEELTVYKDTIIEAINTGYFKFIAHPDIFLFQQKELSKEVLDLCEEIIIAAKEKNIPLEINANGIRKGSFTIDGELRYRYPREEFFELVRKHDATCLISSDAHKPELLYDEAVEIAVKFSRRLKLRVVEELSLDS